MKDLYRFADTYVEIESLCPQFAEMAHDYKAGAPEDGAGALFSIVMSQEDIDAERVHARLQDEREGIEPRNFSDGYLETLAIYRKLCEKLIERDVILFHASAIEADGKAYLFTAPSGTGKSTHARLWREVYGNKVRMINDDKPLLRVGENGATVYGTPWDGKHRLSANVSVPLGGICVISRGETNTIKRLRPAEALPHLLRQIHRPGSTAGSANMTELALKLAAGVPAYALSCNMEPEAARVAYEAMKGE